MLKSKLYAKLYDLRLRVLAVTPTGRVLEREYTVDLRLTAEELDYLIKLMAKGE